MDFSPPGVIYVGILMLSRKSPDVSSAHTDFFLPLKPEQWGNMWFLPHSEDGHFVSAQSQPQRSQIYLMGGASNENSGEGHGNPLRYSCLGNPMDRGAWRATVHRGCKKLDTTEHNTFKYLKISYILPWFTTLCSVIYHNRTIIILIFVWTQDLNTIIWTMSILKKTGI